MQKRKYNTEPNFNNCDVEFGVEFAITGDNSAAVDTIINMKLKSLKECKDFEGSLDQYLTDFAIGYMDAGNIAYQRQMGKLPSVCSNCGSQTNCYQPNKLGFRKIEPSKK